MKRIVTILFLLYTAGIAGDIGGSVSTGFFMGTPFWNADNIGGDKTIDPDDPFMRSVNQLRLYGEDFNGFGFRLNAARSDGFQADNRLSNTKIYEAFAQYQTAGISLQAGRIMPFNRWIMTSLDGGALDIRINDRVKFSAMGGLSVNYGKIWDDTDTGTILYSDLAYIGTGYRVKLKYYHDDEMDKAGADFYSGLGKLRLNGNYGFDITNSRLDDGGLNLSYPVGKRIMLSGNYLLFRSSKWLFPKVEYDPYMIERFMLGMQYLGNGYTVNFKQLAAMNSERGDYISFLTFTHKYFTVGANYLTGDSKMQRLGFTLGANYAVGKNLLFSAGVSPVDYLFYDTSDHQFTTAVYLRARVKFLENFSATANVNYYDNNQALRATTRGGVRLQYNFGG